MRGEEEIEKEFVFATIFLKDENINALMIRKGLAKVAEFRGGDD